MKTKKQKQVNNNLSIDYRAFPTLEEVRDALIQFKQLPLNSQIPHVWILLLKLSAKTYFNFLNYAKDKPFLKYFLEAHDYINTLISANIESKFIYTNPNLAMKYLKKWDHGLYDWTEDPKNSIMPTELAKEIQEPNIKIVKRVFEKKE